LVLDGIGEWNWIEVGIEKLNGIAVRIVFDTGIEI